MLNKDSWMSFPLHLERPAIRSLSLIFILQELAKRFEQVQKFKDFPEPLSEEFSTFFCLNNAYPQVGMCPDKLCFYSDILLQASKIKDHSLLSELDEMRSYVLQIRSQMYARKHLPVDGSGLLSKLQILLQKLSSFFLALVPFLYEAKTDENILLALIEQKEVFNRHLGTHAIENILQRFFPNGHAHLKAIITEGLMRRGFSSFLAEKEHLIDEIEWESTCLTTQD